MGSESGLPALYLVECPIQLAKAVGQFALANLAGSVRVIHRLYIAFVAGVLLGSHLYSFHSVYEILLAPLGRTHTVATVVLAVKAGVTEAAGLANVFTSG